MSETNATVKEEQVKLMHFDVLAKLGYVNEINRVVLNPAGLELICNHHDGNYQVYIHDQRQNPHGYVPKYSDDAKTQCIDDASVYKQYVQKYAHNRIQVFGNIEQHPSRSLSKNMTACIADLLPYIKQRYIATNKDNSMVVVPNTNGDLELMSVREAKPVTEYSLLNLEFITTPGWYLMNAQEAMQLSNLWRTMAEVSSDKTDSSTEEATTVSEPETEQPENQVSEN